MPAVTTTRECHPAAARARAAARTAPRPRARTRQVGLRRSAPRRSAGTTMPCTWRAVRRARGRRRRPGASSGGLTTRKFNGTACCRTVRPRPTKASSTLRPSPSVALAPAMRSRLVRSKARASTQRRDGSTISNTVVAAVHQLPQGAPHGGHHAGDGCDQRLPSRQGGLDGGAALPRAVEFGLRVRRCPAPPPCPAAPSGGGRAPPGW
jgi:hypothetical protein